MGWLGVIAALVLLTAAQEWFYEVHRQRYGLWRPARQRRFWATREERARMWRALMRRDPDPAIERARWIAIVLIVVAIGVLFVAFTIVI